MQNRTVFISGASIAGPALAHWLRRCGYIPTIVERAPALRTGGYKIDLRGIAVTAARRAGILEEVRRQASDVRGASFVDSSGRRLADLDADFMQGREGEDLEIMRGSLSRILYDATRDEVEYLFGDSITSLRQDADGVDVTFDHATPRRHCNWTVTTLRPSRMRWRGPSPARAGTFPTCSTPCATRPISTSTR